MTVTGKVRVSHEQGAGHVPVLLEQVLDSLSRALGGGLQDWVVDGTVGAAGHTAAILETFPSVRVLGIDQDPDTLSRARARLEPFGERARLERGRFSSLAAILKREGIERPAAMLFDLGVSSMQLDEGERGFSFQHDGPLDMRMDPDRERTAADIVNRWDESDLADLFYYEGGERAARRIAAALVEQRRRAPFRRTLALAEAVARATGGRGGRIHPATRTFQALRRAVNEEGEELYAALDTAESCLPDGGALVVISFHSGEDGAVKRFFKQGRAFGRWEPLTKKALQADEAERRANPRSRSARLRAALRRRAPEGRGGRG